MKKRFKKIVSFVKGNKLVVLMFLLGTIGIDIFFIRISSDIVSFGVLLVYAIYTKIFKTNSKLTFQLCMGLLAVMFVNYLLTEASIPTEKTVVWIFLFMVFGIVQQLKEVTS